MMQALLEFLLHLDQHLDLIIHQYGIWTYALLFLILFAETGLVVTPFLPGDSLLFAAGTLAARGLIDPILLAVLLAAAAIAGDTVNYWIGQAAGPAVFHDDRSRLLKRAHLERTRRFFERYGNMTIVLARFVPIVRTFAPFVAGIGRMPYRRFLVSNVAGGVAWVASLVAVGYTFGNLPIVRKNYSLVIVAIVIVSIVPVVGEAWRRRGR
jgi:membrane-associated protein